MGPKGGHPPLPHQPPLDTRVGIGVGGHTINPTEGRTCLDPDRVVPDHAEWCTEDHDSTICSVYYNVVLDETGLA